MTWRNINARYRGSFGGLFWSLIQPLVMMIIYTVVFSLFLKVRSSLDDSPLTFSAYLLCGLLPWTALSEERNCFVAQTMRCVACENTPKLTCTQARLSHLASCLLSRAWVDCLLSLDQTELCELVLPPVRLPAKLTAASASSGETQLWSFPLPVLAFLKFSDRMVLPSRSVNQYMSVVYSCVMDQSPRFAYEAFVWASSLLSYAGQDCDSIIVHPVNQLDPIYQRLFNSLRIKSEIVFPFDARHAHSNKLAQLESKLLQSADYIVLCDCDTVFCESIETWVTGDSVRAKIVDVASLSMKHWRRIFSVAHLPLSASTARSSFDGLETLPTYCNGGLVIIPQPIFQSLRQVWPKWDRWLLDRVELIGPFYFFVDQISLALSCAELGLTIDLLPAELNFPTHLAHPNTADVLPPKVLHYHHRVDQSGFLLAMGIPVVDRQIEKVNDLIRRSRQLDSAIACFGSVVAHSRIAETG